MAEARAAGKAELMNMENGKSKDSPVVCQNNQGFEIRAGVLLLERYVAARPPVSQHHCRPLTDNTGS
jgi:hypothetical protein